MGEMRPSRFDWLLERSRALAVSVKGDYDGPALIRAGLKTETRRLGPIAKHAVGDLLYIAEPTERADQIGIDVFIGWGMAQYVSGRQFVTPHGVPLRWTWKPRRLAARYMTKRFARTIVEIAAVRCHKLREIADDSCFAEGVQRVLVDGEIRFAWSARGNQPAGVNGNPPVVYDTPQEAIFATFQRLHGSKGKEIGNPDVTAYRFRVVAKKEV